MKTRCIDGKHCPVCSGDNQNKKHSDMLKAIQEIQDESPKLFKALAEDRWND